MLSQVLKSLFNRYANGVRVADIIDQHLPVDEQAEFRHGTILSLLIAAQACARH